MDDPLGQFRNLGSGCQYDRNMVPQQWRRRSGRREFCRHRDVHRHRHKHRPELRDVPGNCRHACQPRCHARQQYGPSDMERSGRCHRLQRETFADRRWSLCSCWIRYRHQLSGCVGNQWHNLLLCGFRHQWQCGKRGLGRSQCHCESGGDHHHLGIISRHCGKLWHCGDLYRHGVRDNPNRNGDIQGRSHGVGHGSPQWLRPGNLYHQHASPWPSSGQCQLSG